LLRAAGDPVALGPEPMARLATLAAGFEKLIDEDRPAHAVARRAEARALQAQLAALALEHAPVAQALARAAAALGGARGEPRSFRPLHRLLEQQHYRLAYWRVASDEINYRRFFNINDLPASASRMPSCSRRAIAWSPGSLPRASCTGCASTTSTGSTIRATIARGCNSS